MQFVTWGMLGVQLSPSWCDNEACLLVLQDATSVKRLAYVARRCKFMQELTEEGVILLKHVPGTANPADLMTKYLETKRVFIEYAAWIYNCSTDLMRKGLSSFD